MKPSKLYETLHALIGERVPLHIWGACGVGKSQIVAQVACDLDYDFLDVRAVQLDPVDLRGLPRIAENQTEWVPPKFLPTTGRGILFLYELRTSGPVYWPSSLCLAPKDAPTIRRTLIEIDFHSGVGLGALPFSNAPTL